MSKYITISTSVDVDVDDVLENLSGTELEDLTNDLIADGYGTAPEPDRIAPDLDDPIVRLQVIVELRRLGYTVESTTGGETK